MFNFKPRIEISMLKPAVNDVLINDSNKKENIRKFEINDKVLIYSFCKRGRNWLPGKIMQKIGNVVYLIKCNDDTIRKVHLNNIRISHLDDQLHPESRITD